MLLLRERGDEDEDTSNDSNTEDSVADNPQLQTQPPQTPASPLSSPTSHGRPTTARVQYPETHSPRCGRPTTARLQHSTLSLLGMVDPPQLGCSTLLSFSVADQPQLECSTLLSLLSVADPPQLECSTLLSLLSMVDPPQLECSIQQLRLCQPHLQLHLLSLNLSNKHQLLVLANVREQIRVTALLHGARHSPLWM